MWFENETALKMRAQKGSSLFSTACGACHAPDGSGSGSGSEATAKNLQDSWGEPVTPTDLRQPGLRSGPTLETIYRVLMNGIDGTPMPSFAEAITEEQCWELVAFIAELRKAGAKGGAP